MQTATSETESNSRDLIICVHHYNLRAPCPKDQGTLFGQIGIILAVAQMRTISLNLCCLLHKHASFFLDSRHVGATPWPSGRWIARRRVDTGHAGWLHGLEHARGHAQPRCRGGGGVGRGKGCRHRHRRGGGPPASRNAYGQDLHPVAQRICARRAGRPTQRTGGRVESTAARRGASNHAGRWRQQPPTRRRNRSRRAGTIIRGLS